MAATIGANERDDLGSDLVIIKIDRQAAGNGTWVCGRVHDHRFDALVFPDHADNADWELAGSRISKLWIQRLSDKKTVFNWDRGPTLRRKPKSPARSWSF